MVMPTNSDVPTGPLVGSQDADPELDQGSQGGFAPKAAFSTVKPLPQNRRMHRRYLVKWRMAIVYEGGAGKKTFHGRVNEISLNGLSIHCDYNVFYEGKVILLLVLPPLNAGVKGKTLEISCRMNYTILSQQLFRIGLEFLEFQGNDKKLLEDRLNISNAGGMAYLDV